MSHVRDAGPVELELLARPWQKDGIGFMARLNARASRGAELATVLPHRKELWYMPSLNFGMRAEVAREFAFDERFPTAAGENVDLCLRLRSKYRIGFCPRAKLWHDFGYRSTLTGLGRFVRLFMKYKSSSATLYEGHTVLLWDSSESIYEGNA